MATLVTELVSHQEGQFAVRAVVAVGNQPLVSGLAAHADIEVAEDRARERALERVAEWLAGAPSSPGQTLGSSTFPAPSRPSLEAPTPRPQPPGLDAALPAGPSPQQAPLVGGNAPSTAPTAPAATPNAGAIADFYSHLNADEPPSPAAASSPKPGTKPAKKGARNADPAPAPPPPASESVDLSDVIAQTDIELRRLQWTHVQGREYLEQTYGKRSRQELNEVELYEFLSYLEELPTPKPAGSEGT